MDIEEQRQGAVTVLRPLGPLAVDDATRFKRRAEDALNKSLGRFVIDTSSIPYVDSEGLEALVDLSELLSQSGHALKLCGTNETLREVFDLADVSSLFEHYEDVNTAVRSFL
jgi:anti-sigma B factor antagonist